MKRVALAALFVLSLSACAVVKPWERGDMARRSMSAGFGDQGLSGSYRSKLVQTKAAHATAVGAPGGGCGCSQ